MRTPSQDGVRKERSHGDGGVPVGVILITEDGVVLSRAAVTVASTMDEANMYANGNILSSGSTAATSSPTLLL